MVPGLAGSFFGVEVVAFINPKAVLLKKIE